MQLDYHEKKGPREFVERRKAPQNRPRKQSAGLFVLLSVAALLLSFGAGLSTGWYLFKGAQKAPAVAQPAQRQEPAPAPLPPLASGPEAPLTFYKTLPAGGKGVIGSGLNLKKKEPAVSAPRPAPPAPPGTATASEEKQEVSAGFVVQIASYRERQEADKAQAKLSGKGVAAYVVESKSPDQAPWYRIRVGRHLSKPEAEELAAEAGKGAMVLPE